MTAIWVVAGTCLRLTNWYSDPMTPAADPGTVLFFFSSRRRHTRSDRDWSSDVCSSDLKNLASGLAVQLRKAGGQVFITALGEVAHRYDVLASQDLVHWSTITNVTVPAKIGRASCRERV